jgi:hypothetical protein
LRSALAVALAIAALAGCGGGEEDERGYPEEAVATFVTTCSAQPGASRAACRCMIDRLQATMPYDEFRAADEAAREDREPTRAATAKLRAAADRCR